MSTLAISIEIPSLPEGWQGSPDDLLQWFKDNADFSIDGEFATGQIGGSLPTEDVGIYYGDDSIEKFVSGAYQPISDVPVGSFFPFAGGSAPANYLFCDGSSILRATYPRLFAAIGTTYGSEDATHFTLPATPGRYIVGVGTGDYDLQGITGTMSPLTLGQYAGKEWIERLNNFTGIPTSDEKNVTLQDPNGKYASVRPPSLAANFIIRYR